jgi:hypothetical protein
MSNSRHAVVAIDMGYGHLRPAHAIADALGTEVLQIDQAPLARDKDQKLWAYVRQYYEGVSRASQWPVFGLPLRSLLEQVTDIRDLYSERDQSRPNIAAEVLERVIRKGLGSTLVDYLERRDATLVTTFFMPAIAADRLGYDKIFCIVTDSDIQRVWAPMDPRNTRINYLVPSQRTRRRLRAYGVPESRIRVTGFPLPHRLVGGAELRELKQNLGRRLVRLDPSGNFRKDVKLAISQFLGPLPELSGKDTVPVLTFAVGGAGAQVGLADRFLPGLRRLLDDRRLELVLVAGIRAEVAEQLRDCVRLAGLARQLEPGGSIRIVYETDFPTYLDTFNGVLAQTDVLWTKPSEMTFFAGLGLPLVFSEAVGTHEHYNRRWAREEGAGLKQRDPRFAGEWLKDWLKDGTLAAAAWNGFTRMPSHGLYQILDALGVAERADGLDRVYGVRNLGVISGGK